MINRSPYPFPSFASFEAAARQPYYLFDMTQPQLDGGAIAHTESDTPNSDALNTTAASAFAALGLDERIVRALGEVNYTTPTPVQAQAIPACLSGRDLLVTSQTGSGKTAAFILPAIQRISEQPEPQRPRVDGAPQRVKGRRPRPAPAKPSLLVLTPTRELALQVTTATAQYGRHLRRIVCASILGGMPYPKQLDMLARMPDIIIATPGRLLDHIDSGRIDLSALDMLVFDEADRMLDMGFAEDVQRLVDECPNRQQTMLFSATTGGSGLREMIAKVLNNPEHLQLNAVSQLNSTTRQQIITADHNQHKEQIVNWLLANETYQKAIVFTNTRAMADRIYGRLVAQEYKAFVLHGEKDQKDRKLAIDRLKQGGVKILVATDVAARGLDVDGLDLVINFDMPRSGDEYVHRIGRTGRAGNDGLAISLICHGDWNLMSSIERYLKQSFERRTIKEVKGTYGGPKKVKASGKAVGVKKKKTDAKGDKKKTAAKTPTKRKSVNRPKPDSLVSSDGMAPLKRRKPAEPDRKSVV